MGEALNESTIYFLLTQSFLGNEYALVLVSLLSEPISIITSFSYSFNSYKVPVIVLTAGQRLWTEMEI